ALKVFEDLGYEAVDNLRLSLVPALLADKSAKGSGNEKPKENRPLAVAIDTRNTGFTVEELLATMNNLEQDPVLEPRLVFLECSDDVLQKRLTETRRRPPLALDRPVTDGIKREREMLWKLRDAADQVIDTSLLSIHDLRRVIAGHHRIDNDLGLTLFVTSFSY